MLFDTESGGTDGIDLGDCKTSVCTPGVAASMYIAMMPNPSNNTKWTFSCWLKRAALGVAASLLGTSTATANVNAGNIGFNTSNQLIFYTNTGYWNFITTRVFIDSSAWMCLQVNYDSSQAVSTDRIKFYINGVRETGFATATYPTINRASTINLVDMPHQIGFNGNTYLANVCFLDNANLEPTSFGFKSLVYNEWRSLNQADLANLCSSYGTSSFFFDFKDASSQAALGYDASTHSNDWVVANHILSGPTTNWYNEGPGNPYPTLGAFDPAPTSTLSYGNLRYTGPASGGSSRRTLKPIRGKVYFEVKCTGSPTNLYIGLTTTYNASFPGFSNTSIGWNLATGNWVKNNSSYLARSFTSVSGDTLMFAVDVDNLDMWQGKNGSWYSSYVPPNVSGAVSIVLSSDEKYFVVGSNNISAVSIDCNFGQRPFTYSPPPGFQSMCNLNDSPIEVTNPSEHFDVIADTGANIKAAADARYSGNCIEWIKDRANSANWQFCDTARGLSLASPFPTVSQAETSYVAPTGSSIAYVFNTATSAVTNNQGTTQTLVSGNTVAGISAMAYTPTNSVSFGHGAGRAPDMILSKMRQASSLTAYGWIFWASQSSFYNYNLPNLVTGTAVWSPSGNSVVFGSSGNCDSNYYASYGSVYGGIAYCFSHIPGFTNLKAAYTGNGLTDGPVVYLGFRPKLVIIKKYQVSSGNWVFIDSVRSPGNYVDDVLSTNLSSSEVVTTNTTGAYIQFLSNGFKVCSSHNDVNTSASTYSVVAFADVAETYALAR